MTDSELQAKIIHLGEETAALHATPEYQAWIAELKESIAEIDDDAGTPADEFFAELLGELETKKLAKTAAAAAAAEVRRSAKRPRAAKR